MTFRQWGEKYLYDRGMFPHQATAVIANVATDPINKGGMADRWEDSIDGYPPQILAVLAVSIDAAAIEWIDANLPRAWFRAMFVRTGAAS